jgi:hypothetical protein
MRAELLLRLADHLISDNRGAEVFNFDSVSTSEPTERHPCGTSACAMGELPMCFPSSWVMKKAPHADHVYLPVRRLASSVGEADKDVTDLANAVAEFFEQNPDAYDEYLAAQAQG